MGDTAAAAKGVGVTGLSACLVAAAVACLLFFFGEEVVEDESPLALPPPVFLGKGLL